MLRAILAAVDTVDQHRTGRGGIETAQQASEGRFARSDAPHDGDPLARFDGEIEVGKRSRGFLGITEFDAFENDPRARDRCRGNACAQLALIPTFEHALYAFERFLRLPPTREKEGNLTGRSKRA